MRNFVLFLSLGLGACSPDLDMVQTEVNVSVKEGVALPYTRAGTGLCNDPLGVRVFDGDNGDNSGADKLDKCATACFNKNPAKIDGWHRASWDRGDALGFGMASNGRCYCNHKKHASCVTLVAHSYTSYDFSATGSYYLGSLRGVCSSGLERITSEVECNSAITYLRLAPTGIWTGSYTRIPRGCSFKPGGGETHFNRADTGVGRHDLQPVCRSFAPAREYTISTVESQTCTVGEQVMTQQECQAAAAALGKRWYYSSVGSWWNHVSGCFEGSTSGSGNGNMHFNKGGYGKFDRRRVGRGFGVCGSPTVTSPAITITGSGLCNARRRFGVGVRVFNGDGDNSRGDALEKCAIACFNKSPAKDPSRASWSSRGDAYGFGMASSGRCYCNHKKHASCTKTSHNYVSYDYAPVVAAPATVDCTLCSCSGWNGHNYHDCHETHACDSGYCVHCQVDGITAIGGPADTHASKCRTVIPALAGPVDCTLCSCSEWDGQTQTYSNCHKTGYACNSGFCVHCHLDGVTAIPGPADTHASKCRTVISDPVDCTRCSCSGWDGQNYNNCHATEDCTSGFCVHCHRDGVTAIRGPADTHASKCRVDCKRCSCSGWDGQNYNNCHATDNCTSGFCAHCHLDGVTAIPGPADTHASKCSTVLPNPVDGCRPCSCTGWDGQTQTYSNCHATNDCGSWYCVLCHADGVTAISGPADTHVSKCRATAIVGGQSTCGGGACVQAPQIGDGEAGDELWNSCFQIFKSEIEDLVGFNVGACSMPLINRCDLRGKISRKLKGSTDAGGQRVKLTGSIRFTCFECVRALRAETGCTLSGGSIGVERSFYTTFGIPKTSIVATFTGTMGMAFGIYQQEDITGNAVKLGVVNLMLDVYGSVALSAMSFTISATITGRITLNNVVIAKGVTLPPGLETTLSIDCFITITLQLVILSTELRFQLTNGGEWTMSEVASGELLRDINNHIDCGQWTLWRCFGPDRACNAGGDCGGGLNWKGEPVNDGLFR